MCLCAPVVFGSGGSAAEPPPPVSGGGGSAGAAPGAGPSSDSAGAFSPPPDPWEIPWWDPLYEPLLHHAEDVVLLELGLGDGGLISLDFTMPSPGRMEGECRGDGGIYGGGWLER